MDRRHTEAEACETLPEGCIEDGTDYPRSTAQRLPILRSGLCTLCRWRAGRWRTIYPEFKNQLRKIPDFACEMGVGNPRRIRNTEVVWTLFRRKPAPPPADPPLAGAPQRARLKSYSAQSGYVYQYVYRGHRAAGQAETEYVFSATSDRKNWRLICVILDQATIDRWSSGSGRVLLPVESYAIAKLALFDFFDASMDRYPPAPLRPSAEDITRYLDSLGRM